MIPWKIVLTVTSLLLIALVFGILFVLTGDNATLAIASAAAGGIITYLGRVNGSPSDSP